MPGKVGVKIKAGRNLPIMDRGSDTTDAYVEIKLGNVTHKTDVCRKSLNPQWNTDWFRFEVDDAELQDEPLQIRLMDYDTYSANDAIGKVNISLNPLCLETSGQTTQGKGTVLSGWIPVFDTMHGIRGEVNVIVKVDLFSDLNKFRQSSCGIPFFHSQCIPYGYRAQVIHGFVEELVVNDDPEYQWIDKIRTPRASNEARQVVFLKLSGQVQRKMGLKAINMGANAVIGYTQCFDLEGDVGVVARGIGTAVTLIKDVSLPSAAADNALIEERTIKYLEFLTGSTRNLSEQPKVNFQIKKSQSSTFFELKRDSIEENDTELMEHLMQQEDARGEKPKKKLKQHVQRFKHSSRNLLNDKYAALMRKLGDSSDSKSHDSNSRSFSNIFVSSMAQEESQHATKRNMAQLEVRRQSFKAKHKTTKPLVKQTNRRSSLKKTTHPIARSISEDSTIPTVATRTIMTPKIAAIEEYQDNTRSSPNISANVHKRLLQASKETADRAECDTIRSGSSTTVSLTMTESTTSEESKFDYAVFKRQLSLETNEEVAEEDVADDTSASSEEDSIESLLRRCDIDAEEDKCSQHWIQPGQTESFDDSLTDLRPHHSLLHELKAFSQHVQDLIHMPSKASKAAKKAKALEAETIRRTPTNTLAFKYLSPDDRKSFYSSQPEIVFADNPNMLTVMNTQLKHSRSLSNLPQIANASTLSFNLNNTANKNNSQRAATNDDLPITLPYSDAAPETLPNFPILQICPSTPTPSESDHSQFSPSILDTDSNLLTTPSSSNASLAVVESLEPLEEIPTTVLSLQNKIVKSQSSHNICSSDAVAPSTHLFTAKSNSTNHYHINNASLLAPSHNTITLRNNNNNDNKKQRYRRSLNEINATTDSPGIKRFASPASAAVAAAAAAIANATGPMLDNRSKLTPSPSKVGLATAQVQQADSGASSTTTTTTSSTATTMISKETGEICRRSSDSDLSVTPKGNSFCVASERLVAATAMMRLSQPIVGKTAGPDSMDMLEYPFLTMTKYPPGFILHLGATVAARSVKLLERVPNPDEPEVRDFWWTELRMEIRSHARALGCNVVLGYSETTTISEDVCVLSATGTAAVINMAYNRSVSQNDIFTMTKPGAMSVSLEDRDVLKEVRNNLANDVLNKETTSSYSAASGKKYTLPAPSGIAKTSCAMCHIPYNLTSVPFNVKMKKCAICRKGRVPDVLLATLEVPEYLQVTGRGCFMQAQVVRAKKDLRAELNAKEISDGLPFLEYELHRVLINKLKAKGMNAIFGLRAQVSIGERMIALIATGTALFLSALPVPQVPKIVAGNSWTDKQKLNELQKKLQETFERNQEIYQLKCTDPDLVPSSNQGGGGGEKQSDTDESDDEVIEIDLNCGNKDTCVLEVDDIEDLEIISLLMEQYPPEGFHVVNTQMVPGMLDMEAVKNLQMFAQVWRAKLDIGGQNISGFPKHFQRLLQTIYFKLRTMIPCAICDLRFKLDLPESDQIQLLVTGMALGLGDVNKFKYRRKTVNGPAGGNNANDNNAMNANQTPTQVTESNGTQQGNKRALQEEDYIFPLDEDQMVQTPTPTTNLPPYGSHSLKLRKTSPSRTTSKANAAVRNRFFPLRDRYGVDITPLSFVPGGKIDKYLGNLNFFFIRESTSIREHGGISGFVHSFITELLAVVRAHISSLGGNAMVSFYMTELILVDNQHKNQGQCLISIGGDAVYVSYYSDD